jgi:hypothetical protein
MRKLISVTLLGVLILSAGCIRSLHPIYTKQDIVFEPDLIGQWSEDDDESDEVWAFSKEDANSYALVYTDDNGEQGMFNAHLAEIKGELFLDFFPNEPELIKNGFYQFHLLPVHTFVYVKQIEPTLQWSFPDPDWLEEHIAANPDAIRHEKIEDEIILTAAAKDLQAFWLKHLDAEVAFGELSNLKRKKKVIPEEQPNKSPSSESPIIHDPDTFEILGTVVYNNLEGGFFAIDGDNGSKYDPISLPESFRKDGLKVKVTARLRKDAMSMHMYGSIIEVVNIAGQ